MYSEDSCRFVPGLTRVTRGFAAMALAMWTLLGAPSAGAAQTPAEEAAAEALFQQGRELMQAERYAEACEKFAASNRLDPALGTVLNLAACLESDGRLASAWAKFVEAGTIATREGSAQRAAVARQRAAALEPRLVRVQVNVPERVPGLRVTIGGRAFPEATWGTPIPIDPGEWEVVAEAPGHISWTRHAIGTEEGAVIEVDVPALEAQPIPDVREAPPPIEPTPAVFEEPRGGSPATWVLLGAGVAAIGVGFGLGANASNLWDRAEDRCPANLCATPTDQADAEAAARRANAATTLVIVGGAMAAGSLVVGLLTRASDDGEDEDSEAIRVTPSVSPRHAGISLGGSF